MIFQQLQNVPPTPLLVALGQLPRSCRHLTAVSTYVNMSCTLGRLQKWGGWVQVEHLDRKWSIITLQGYGIL